VDTLRQSLCKCGRGNVEACDHIAALSAQFSRTALVRRNDQCSPRSHARYHDSALGCFHVRDATREHDAEPTNLALGGRLSTRWPVLRVPCSRCRPARDSGRWNFARGADSKERYRIAPRRPDVPNRLQFCASYVSGARCESRDETVSFRCTANRGFYFRAVGEAPGLHYLSAWAMRSCHRSAPRLSSSHASARPRWSSRADECLVLNAACAVRVTFDRSR